MQLSNLQEINYQKIKSLYQNPVISASIEVILTVFAVAFMVFFALRPTLTIVAQLRRKIEDQTEVSQKLNAKIRSLQLAQKNLARNAKSLDGYKTAIPDGPHLVSLSKKIEILAQENGVAISTFRIAAVPMLGNKLSFDTKAKKAANSLRQNQTVILPLSLDIEGGLAAIENFINGIEKMDRLLMINSLSIKKEFKGSRDKDAYLSAAIKAEVYYKFVNKNEN